MERIYLEETDSTNKWAKENIDKLPDFCVVFTYKQMAGRGRLNRKWSYMGEGNIYASIVLKLKNDNNPIYSNLTQYLCLVLAEVFEEYNTVPKIKWPNDIRINGKKISGILAEGVNIGNGLNFAIILGFGVNLNCRQEDVGKIDQPVTSLNLETGMEIDRESFFNRVLDKFCLSYDKFIGRGFLSIREEYLKRAEFLNKNVAVKVMDKTVEGIASDVTETGALKVIDNNNNEQILYIGDIL